MKVTFGIGLLRGVLFALLCLGYFVCFLSLLDPQKSHYPFLTKVFFYFCVFIGFLWLVTGYVQGKSDRENRTTYRNQIRELRKGKAFVSFRRADHHLAGIVADMLSSFGWQARMWDPDSPFEGEGLNRQLLLTHYLPAHPIVRDPCVKRILFEMIHESSLFIQVKPLEESPWMQVEEDIAKWASHRIIKISDERDLINLRDALNKPLGTQPSIIYQFEQLETLESIYTKRKIPGEISGMFSCEMDPVITGGKVHLLFLFLWIFLLPCTILLAGPAFAQAPMRAIVISLGAVLFPVVSFMIGYFWPNDRNLQRLEGT